MAQQLRKASGPIESGNIRLSTQFKWTGQVQGTDKDFCVFGNYLPDRRELRRGYERGMGQLLVPSDKISYTVPCYARCTQFLDKPSGKAERQTASSSIRRSSSVNPNDGH